MTNHRPKHQTQHIGRTVVMMVGVGALCAVLMWRWSNVEGDSVHEERLSVNEATLNMGTVWAQRRFPWKLQLENNTEIDVAVDDLKATCLCMSIEPVKFVVPAKGSVEITLLLDLVVNRSKSAAAETTPFSVDIIALVSGQPDERLTWTLTGAIRKSANFSPAELFFDETSNQWAPEHRLETQEVSFSVPVPLQDVSVRVHPADRGTAVARFTTSTSGIVEVTPAADLRAGPFAFDVELSGVTVRGEQLPVSVLPVRGVCLRDIYAVPAAVTFGPCKIGDIVETTVVLNSRTKRLFSVKSITGQSNAIQVEPIKVKGGVESTAHLFRVRQRIVNEGAQQGEIVIETSSPGATATDAIIIPVRYVGIKKEG